MVVTTDTQTKHYMTKAKMFHGLRMPGRAGWFGWRGPIGGDWVASPYLPWSAQPASADTPADKTIGVFRLVAGQIVEEAYCRRNGS